MSSPKLSGTSAASVTESASRFLRLQNLPRLDDHALVGERTHHTVLRDDEPDLRFEGVLLAAVAPTQAIRERWREYRVYATTSGKHVFSRIGRSAVEWERDKFEAEIFDPKTADSRGRTWEKRAAHFFGFDDLAKKLYAALNIDTAEEI